jgi:hypothetical protein
MTDEFDERETRRRGNRLIVWLLVAVVVLGYLAGGLRALHVL